MTNREISEKLNKAFRNAAPDVLEEALADARTRSVLPPRAVKAGRKKSRAAYFLAAAAAVILLLGIGFIIGTLVNRSPGDEVYATVSIDVNPSLEIKINREERVLEVIPLNDDAVTVIGGMDFTGSTIELTVNALIGSMYRHGFLNESNNSVLVSLDNEDADGAKDLLERITAQISEILDEQGGGNVIVQSAAPNERVKELARKYGVSESKAALAAELTAIDPSWEASDLGTVSIEQLDRLVTAAREFGYSTVNTVCLPPDACPDLDEAVYRALALAGVPTEHIVLKKAFFYGDVWRYTSNAAEFDSPDILARMIWLDDGYAACVEFTYINEAFFVITEETSQSVSSRNVSSPSNPIHLENIPKTGGRTHLNTLAHVIWDVINSNGITPEMINYPLSCEMTDEDCLNFHVMISVEGELLEKYPEYGE